MTAAHPQTAFDITNKNITSSQSNTSNRFHQNSLLSIMSNQNSAMNRFGDEIPDSANRFALPRSTADSSDGDMAAKHAQDNDGASSVGDDDGNQGENSRKRFLPDHKKPDAAPTFPEKLMKLMRHAEKQDEETFCVAWMEDGKSFIIRNPDEFTREVVPKFFKATKFSSFTRKLYRWGFRQVNRGIGPDDPIIFGNEHFQRDNATLMAKMRSITAAGTRKQEQQLQKTSSPMFFPGMKHHLDDSMGLMGAFGTGFSVDESGHKRMMLEHIYQQQQKNNLLSQTCGVNPSMNSNCNNNNNNNGMFSGMSSNGSLSLTNALRPNMSSMNAMNSFNNVNQNNMCPPQPTASSMIMQNIHSSNLGMGNCGGGNSMNDMTSFDMLMQQHQNGGSMNAPFMNNNMGMNMNNMNNNMGCNGINNSNSMNSIGNLPNNFGSNLQQSQQQQFCCGMGGMGSSSSNGYHNTASTAEIVNAAIAALRYAS